MSDNQSVILKAQDVHRQFSMPEGVLPVLKGIDLDLKEGEVIAVTGASGVGKSTLLHILGGLDRPTTGEITVKGVAFGDQSEQSLARFRNRHVGFVFQFHYLLQDFTALENVMIPILLSGASRPSAVSRGEQLLELVGLYSRKTHRPSQLSGGEQQRVAVARALANNPEIVLADEPSGNLDTSTGRSLHDLLLRLNVENKTTFLIATHNQELATACHRRLRMADGRLLEN